MQAVVSGPVGHLGDTCWGLEPSDAAVRVTLVDVAPALFAVVSVPVEAPPLSWAALENGRLACFG